MVRQYNDNDGWVLVGTILMIALALGISWVAILYWGTLVAIAKALLIIIGVPVLASLTLRV
jgi:zinc transporter ZupT